MSSSSVDTIKERVSIEEVVGSYITLEKSGTNFKAKCPFHNERTPSFYVSPARGSYYCFGCGAKGDIFSFVQQFEGLDFPEALKLLAQKAGVELPRMNKTFNERDILYKALESACSFYESKLKENPHALEYLLKRGLTEETIKEWRIGYAPPGWRTIGAALAPHDIDERLLIRVGLLKKSDNPAKGDGVYDIFRDRVVFPIFDSSGRPVGFSGRLLGASDTGPKYLNTPETELFNKSDILYGLDKAKIAIRKKDFSILVEGQMDLLMCHQAGFANTVATSGTAFTEAHLTRLSKLSKRILMVFDSDDAGFRATEKSATLALSMGMEVKVATLPKGTDPAELILYDVSEWKNALRDSKHIVEYYVDVLVTKTAGGRTLAKEIQNHVLPLIALIPSAVEKSHYVNVIAKKTGLREEAVWDDLRTLPVRTVDTERDQAKEIKRELSHNHVVRRIAGLLFWLEASPNPILEFKPFLERITGIVGKEGVDRLYEEYKETKQELIFEAENYYDNAKNVEREIGELAVSFEEDVLRAHFVTAMVELERAEAKGDEKEVEKILQKCQDISVRLTQLQKTRAEGT